MVNTMVTYKYTDFSKEILFKKDMGYEYLSNNKKVVMSQNNYKLLESGNINNEFKFVTRSFIK